MTWTYSGDPASSSRDAVRFTIGDTNVNDQQLQDEEIDYNLTLDTPESVLRASIRSVIAIIALVARQVSQGAGRLSKSFSDRLGHYKDLLATLQDEFSTTGGGLVSFYAGGLSESEEDSDKDDDDLRQNQFEVGQDDNPLVGEQGSRGVDTSHDHH